MPIAPPITMPTAISQYDTMWRSSSVTASAMKTPMPASMLPERAVAGELSRRSPRMSRTDATI